MVKNVAPVMALITGAGVFAAAAAPVEAAEIKTFDVDTLAATGQPAQVTLSFAKFDSNLGDLTKVRFTLGADYVSNASAKVILGSEGATGTASVTGEFGITGPANVSLYSDSANATASCTNPFGVHHCTDDSDPAPAVFLPLVVELTSGLGDYETAGSGSFDVDVSVALASETCTSFGLVTCEFSANWSGTLTVEFVYTPRTTDPGTDVDEPGALALFGLSLLGLGAVSRARRKR